MLSNVGVQTPDEGKHFVAGLVNVSEVGGFASESVDQRGVSVDQKCGFHAIAVPFCDPEVCARLRHGHLPGDE